MEKNDEVTIKNVYKNMSISNKDALKDKIHDIHNYLRNNGAGYGMNALKVFNLLYGLKKIEENNLFDKVNLHPKCKFSYLLELANSGEDEKLPEHIDDVVLESINESEIKNLIFYEIPKNIKGSVFSFLIKEIQEITTIEKISNVLLSGKIYEYFIGRDETAITELGAYFTDRHITNYIYENLNLKITEDGKIGSMIDPFGGSGGFTTGYIDYMKNKFQDKIDWETEMDKVYHYDMNEDVIKSAGLEFFCLTSVFPKMETNLKYKNSFTDEFSNSDGRTYKYYDYVITNPPYGGDKVKKSDSHIKWDKVKDYIKKGLKDITDETVLKNRNKQLKEIEAFQKQNKNSQDKSKVSLDTSSNRINKFAAKYKLNANDKEACSLILLMDLLEKDGICAGVLKEGVFFNSAYKGLRKVLIENYNVKEIISVPSDQFENTNTKTSIVIFENTTKKTSEVIFKDLVIEKYDKDVFVEENDMIYLKESKGDIKNVCDSIISRATSKEILNNRICSLNGKDYNKKEIVCGKEYELVKLGDICEFLPKSKRNASFGNSTGKYNFYTSSDKVQKCDIADYNQECIIIGTGGNSCIHLLSNTKFSCSADTLIIFSNRYYNKFLYYTIKSTWNLLTEKMRGSTIKHVTKDILTNLQIPVPKSQDKIKEWVDKISAPYDRKIQKETRFKELETNIQDKIKFITENAECDEVELGTVCEVQDGFEFKNNELTTNTNNIPLVRATYIQNNAFSHYIIFNNKYDKYKVNYGDIIMSQVGNVGSITKYKETQFGYNKRNAFKIVNKNINKNYLYYYLKSDEFKKTIISNGSIVKFISIPNLLKIIIKIPKDKKVIQELEPIFDEIEKLQTEIKDADAEYKKYIQELSDEAIPKDDGDVITETIILPSSPKEESDDTNSSTSSKTSVDELKKQCKSLGLKGYCKLNKDELIKLLETSNPAKDNSDDTNSSTSSKTSVNELKKQCKSLGLKGYCKLNKAELIKLLSK